MPGRLTFGRTFQVLEKAINIAQQRHSVIASNISNVDTPNYKAKDLDFKMALSQALKGGHADLTATHPRHFGYMAVGSYAGETSDQEGEWNGINWVDVDQEMIKLTENNLVYRTGVEALLKKIALLREVIKEGGR